MDDPARDKVFISYSHKDKKWLERLQTMLKPLVRKEAITIWADTQIQAGSKWREEIEAALSSSKVAVLLVSQNFLASDFITDHELPALLGAAEKQGVTILWVALGACLYDETDISRYQSVNNPARPLEELNGAALNKELVNIARQIKAAASPIATAASNEQQVRGIPAQGDLLAPREDNLFSPEPAALVEARPKRLTRPPPASRKLTAYWKPIAALVLFASLGIAYLVYRPRRR